MIISRVIFTVFLFIFIWIWNKYVPKHIVKSVGNFHRKFNQSNLDKQPLRFVLANEDRIINLMKAFYWIGFLLIAKGILVGEIP